MVLYVTMLDFFSSFFRKTGSEPESSFSGLSDDEMEAHLSIDRYGDFQLTDAIRPAYRPTIVPVEGYKYDYYDDCERGESIPVIMAAVSREKLYRVFMSLIEPLGDMPDVVLETSHVHYPHHLDLYREGIDMPVLQSILSDPDTEDVLMNDGCAGIAVLNPDVPLEVQFDEHKLLIIYAEKLQPFARILEEENVPHRLLTGAEHMHSSSRKYATQFARLATELALDGVQDEEAHDDEGRDTEDPYSYS